MGEPSLRGGGPAVRGTDGLPEHRSLRYRELSAQLGRAAPSAYPNPAKASCEGSTAVQGAASLQLRGPGSSPEVQDGRGPASGNCNALSL